MVRDALEHRGEWITFDCRLTRTRAATAAGRYDEAEEGFRSTIERAEELGLRIEGADVRRLYSGMLLEQGDQADREAARSFLDEAESMPRWRCRPRVPREVDVGLGTDPRRGT